MKKLFITLFVLLMPLIILISVTCAVRGTSTADYPIFKSSVIWLESYPKDNFVDMKDSIVEIWNDITEIWNRTNKVNDSWWAELWDAITNGVATIFAILKALFNVIYFLIKILIDSVFWVFNYPFIFFGA